MSKERITGGVILFTFNDASYSIEYCKTMLGDVLVRASHVSIALLETGDNNRASVHFHRMTKSIPGLKCNGRKLKDHVQV